MSEQTVVVVKILTPGSGEYGEATGAKITDWGRDTLAVAEAFVRSPKWPAKATDEFVAIDDWGYGVVVAAQREELLGLNRRQLIDYLTHA